MCIGRNSNLDKCKYGQMLDSNKQNGKYWIKGMDKCVLGEIQT